MGKRVDSQILCGDVRSLARYHSVSLVSPGLVKVACAVNEGTNSSEKLATFAALGHTVDDRGCHGFKALVEHGLPQIIEHADFRGWRSLYIRYQDHSIVKAEEQRLRDRNQAAYSELIRHLRAFYRPHRDVLFQIVEVDEPRTGQIVGCSRSDASWTIEVQKHWRASVDDLGIAVLDGKLVVGVGIKRPGVVYAIERNAIGHFVVAEFLLDPRTKKIVRIAA